MKIYTRTSVDDSQSKIGRIPWESLEERSASAFILAGSVMIASVITPVGLSVLTGWAWASGLFLIGLAVIAAVVGLFGLYSQIGESVPRVAFAGVLAAGVAGIVALSLLAALTATIVAELGFGMSVPRPIDAFVVGSSVMASGLSLGFLLLGIAAEKTDAFPQVIAYCLIIGGIALLVPVVVQLLGSVARVQLPAWVVFLSLGVVALDTLVIGSVLPSKSEN